MYSKRGAFAPFYIFFIFAKNHAMQILLKIFIFLLPVFALQEESISAKLEQKERELSYEINRAYAQYALENNRAIPFFDGFSAYFKRVNRSDDPYRFVSEPYQETGVYQALTTARHLLNRLDDELYKIMAADIEYQELVTLRLSRDFFADRYNGIRARLERDNQQYYYLMRRWRSELIVANINCLYAVITDYEQKKIAMPTEWIPLRDMKVVMRQKSVKKLDKEVQKIRKQGVKR